MGKSERERHLSKLYDNLGDVNAAIEKLELLRGLRSMITELLAAEAGARLQEELAAVSRKMLPPGFEASAEAEDHRRATFDEQRRADAAEDLMDAIQDCVEYPFDELLQELVKEASTAR